MIAISFLWCAGTVGGFRSQAQEQDTSENVKTKSSPGQAIFRSTCAACHGLDGQGGQKAPGISGSDKAQHLSDTELSSIISNGIAGTGMPAFHSLSVAQVRAVVGYLRGLQGKFEARTAPGDPKSGKRLFFGKGDCSTCHGISGEGGFIGPDLSTYGSAKSAQAILQAIIHPARSEQSGYKSATVTTREGNHVKGAVRNEDNFSLQLQAEDGLFYFLKKSDLQSLEYSPQSLMPTNYAEKLNRGELDDLVSYLMTAGAATRGARTTHEGTSK